MSASHTFSVLSAAAADDAFAIRAERHAQDSVRVPLEGEDLLSLVCIPYLHRLVRSAADEAFAVGAERHADDVALCAP